MNQQKLGSELRLSHDGKMQSILPRWFDLGQEGQGLHGEEQTER